MSGASGEERTGGCLCGAIRYRVTGPMRPVVACHCSQCRRTSGHHVAATSAPRASVEITGEPRWYQSSPTARRGFCPVCGSQLFWDGPGVNLSIFAGTLDDAEGLTLAGHIFCADKGAYYEIADGTPQRPGADPAFTTQVQE
ncbi:MAG: GFA family protein [Pseudomonadota bacterium]